MDLVTLKTESTISGVLVYVLGLSRLCGIAPLKLERVSDGWRIRVSAIYCLHAYAIVSLSSLIYFCIMGEISGTFIKGHGIINAISVLIQITVVFNGIFTGTKRMRHLIDTVEKLRQIYQELSVCSQLFSTSQIKIWLFVITYSSLATANTSAQIGIFARNIVTNNESGMLSVWILSFYLAYCAASVITGLLLLQFTISAMLVLMTFTKLNEYLQDLLKKIHKNASGTTTFSSSLHKHTLIKTSRPSNIFTRSVQKSFTNDVNPKAVNELEGVHHIPMSIHRCALLFCCLCGFIRRLNNDNGLLLVLLILSIQINLISTPYYLVLQLQTSTYFDLLKILLECSWIIYHSSKLLLLVEPCHRAYEQMDLTRSLIHQMKRYTVPGDYALITELKMFQRHIMLNQVTYSPFQLFTLNRNILVTILGSVITYLVIVLQL